MRPPLGLALALLLPLAAPAGAIVLGGGAADKDCRVAFSGIDATAGASGVVCTDGDPACDADATADGACSFAVAVCVNVAAAGCDTAAVDEIAVGGDALALPDLPAADGACGATSAVTVPVGGVAATTIRAYGKHELRDVDYLNLCCVATDDPLAAATCALAVDLSASGCASVPAGAVRKLERARERLARAQSEPAGAPKQLRKAARFAGKVRRKGQKIARRDDCGFALGLVASHAEDVLRAAAP